MCSTIRPGTHIYFLMSCFTFCVCVHPLTIYHDVDDFTNFNFPIRFVSGWSTTFIVSLPLQGDFSLCNFHISSSGLFFPVYRSAINLSCKAGLVVLNSFSFCLSVELSVSPSDINESRAGLNILSSGFYSFITLNILCRSLLACKISAEKSADCLMGVPLFITSCLSLAAFNSFFNFWHFSYNMSWYGLLWASQVALVVKNFLPMQEMSESLIPGSRTSPGGGHSKPLQYSCLENPVDRGAWWATVHRIAKSWTWLKQLTHTHRLLWDSFHFGLFVLLGFGCLFHSWG